MGSARTSPSEGGGTGGSFKCDYPRCNKTFTRKDHLIRHQANHSTTTFPCPICGRLFKRLDLLQRHEKRNICAEAGPSTSSRRLTPSNTGGKIHVKTTQKRKRSPSSSSSSSASSDGNLSPVQLAHDLKADRAGLELINGWNRAQDAEELKGWETTVREMLPSPFGRSLDMGQRVDWDDLKIRSKASRGKRNGDRGVSVTPPTILRLRAEYSGYNRLFDQAETYISHFFTFLAPSFPIIHRTTFDPDSPATPLHLTALTIVLGAASTSNSTPGPSSSNHSDLVNSIRKDLVDKLGSDDLEIEILQTLTLCYIYEYHFAPPDIPSSGEGSRRGISERRDKAVVCWAGVVAHLTRKGIGVRAFRNEVENGEVGQGDVERLWRKWVREEERFRLAYTILHLDLLSPLYTHHPPTRPCPMISYDLPPPASRTLWEYSSAEEWLELYNPPQTKRANGRPSAIDRNEADLPGGIVSVLKGITNGPRATMLKVALDHALAVRSVVLDLVGVGWDCKIYGTQMYPAIGEEGGDKSSGQRWRKGIQDAVIHFRATWEGATQHLPSCTEIRDMRDLFGISILSVLSDIPTLLGMTTSPPSPAALPKAQIWVKTEDAFTCLWQSARYLKQALFADWGIYTAEVVYLSTLVLYTYAITSLPSPLLSTPTLSPSESTHILLDSILASNTKPNLANEPILDLLTCSAEMMSTKTHVGRTDTSQVDSLRGLIERHTAGKLENGYAGNGIGGGDQGNMDLLAELLPASLLPSDLPEQGLNGDIHRGGISGGSSGLR